MSISEVDMPGIGRRYEIVAGKGQRIVLVIHHSGRRDLYVIDRHADEPTGAVELTDDQARRIGVILGGAFFKPAMVEEIEDIVGEFVVDWVTLPGGCRRRRKIDHRTADPTPNRIQRDRHRAGQEDHDRPTPRRGAAGGRPACSGGPPRGPPQIRRPDDRVTEMSNALVALGGAFVAAGLLARLGRRVGLPPSRSSWRLASSPGPTRRGSYSWRTLPTWKFSPQSGSSCCSFTSGSSSHWMI